MAKFVKDAIHGLIQLPELCVKIMDTSEFQRLRYIKQLGLCHFVFPSANHTRFEHSIGVSHLAGKLLQQLKHNQPELGLTDHIITLVQIGGLCHDLGHGPFSHTFDDEILPALGFDHDDPMAEHESRSCILLEHIIDTYAVDLSSSSNGSNCSNGDMVVTHLEALQFIKDVIVPSGRDKTCSLLPASSLMRKWCSGDYDFLLDIVCNSKSGLDVDKLDYISRDMKYLDMNLGMDCGRLLQRVRVINGQLCYPDKVAGEVYQVYETRYKLFRRVYNHKTVKAIEYMIVDMIKKSRGALGINSCIRDLDSDSESVKRGSIKRFCRLTDDMLQFVPLVSVDCEQLYDRIVQRQLYPLMDTFHGKEAKEFDLGVYCQHKESNDYIVQRMNVGVGKKDYNPVDKVLFYNVNEPNKAFKLSKDSWDMGLMPESYQEHIVRVFYRDISF